MGAAARDPTPVLGTLPGAREVLRTLDSDTPHPAVCLVRGRCGTGKSTLLAQIREVFARRGIRCRDDIGAALDSPDDAAALIIDDAQALDRRQLEQLCATVESRSAPLIIATRPLPHDEALAAVAAAVARRGRVLDLRTLGTTDITLFARELGVRVPNRLADHIHRRTGGIPAGVVAALSAVRTTHADAGQAPVDRAIDAWARALLDKFPPHLLEILTVATAGPGLDPAELTRVLDLDIATAIGRIDQARSCAVITDADLVLEPAIPHLRPRIGEQRFLALGRRLLTVRLAAGLLDASTAIHLAESGVRDERLVEYLCAAAENASANKNAAGEANRYYRAAVAAGCPPERITVPWAYAAVADGDDAEALRLAEPILALADPTAEDWADAVRICAGAWARAGLIERARRLYSRLGAEYTEADRANAATVFTLAGAVDEAAHARTPAARADTRGARLATALAQTIGTEPADGASAAAATLINVARTAIPTDRTLPCPPALPAALLCLSIGEAHRAAEWLRDADPRDPRIRILRAWTAMFSGDEPGAARDMTAVDTADLAPRERLLAHGALVGLARRAGDHGALARAWRTACPTVDQVDADLTAVLPIGELRLAGIRLGEQDRIAGPVAAVRAVLRRAGDPPAWANISHWYDIQAAIAEQRANDLPPAVSLLRSAARSGDWYATILADAGQTWVLVLRGEVAAKAVSATVRRLAAIGMVWDAARLASEAALRADDPATATALLKLARTFRDGGHTAGPSTAGSSSTSPPGPALTAREREVAELVLLGLTYREVGAQLFISAKTVEHHIARIRRRIGAGSRSELLSMLRAMGYGPLPV